MVEWMRYAPDRPLEIKPSRPSEVMGTSPSSMDFIHALADLSAWQVVAIQRAVTVSWFLTISARLLDG